MGFWGQMGIVLLVIVVLFHIPRGVQVLVKKIAFVIQLSRWRRSGVQVKILNPFFLFTTHKSFSADLLIASGEICYIVKMCGAFKKLIRFNFYEPKVWKVTRHILIPGYGAVAVLYLSQNNHLTYKSKIRFDLQKDIQRHRKKIDQFPNVTEIKPTLLFLPEALSYTCATGEKIEAGYGSDVFGSTLHCLRSLRKEIEQYHLTSP